MGVVSSINESLDNSRVGDPASQQNIKKKSSDDIQNNFLTLLLTQMKIKIRLTRCKTMN